MALEDKVLTFEQDVQIMHEIVHGPETDAVATEGGPLRTMAKLQLDLENDLNAAAAITETGQNRQAAEDAMDGAEAARAEAELARDAAQLASGIYADVTAGLAATAPDKYFNVPSTDNEEYLILYFNNAGTAEPIESYPSASALDAARQTISEAQSAQVQMATELVRTQAIIAEHHAFS